MSDLSLQLQQAQAQLPVNSYFDEALFQRELETIFQSGPRYVGHQLAVPDRKSTRLNSSHIPLSRMPSSA